MSYGVFVPYDLVGCGLWSAAFVFLGYAFWQNLHRAVELASQGTLAIGGIVVVGVLVYVYLHFLRTSEQRDQAREWLAEQGIGRARHNER
jgi:undecaprenyl-diphosphatase